jgi:hypothetical protein
MADSRRRFTNAEVLAFFRKADSSDEEDDRAEETFSEYIGVNLGDSDEDNSTQDESNDENTDAKDVPPLVSAAEQGILDDEHQREAIDSDGDIECEQNGEGSPKETSDDHQRRFDPFVVSDTTDISSDDSLQLQHSESDNIDHDDSEEQESNSVAATISDHDSEPDSSPQPTSFRVRGRARGGGRARGRGRVRGGGHARGRGRARGRGQERRARVRGATSVRSRSQSYHDFIPASAKPISEVDANFAPWNVFEPVREPGPQLPDPSAFYTPLELLRLFITDDVLDKFVVATKAYADTEAQESDYVHKVYQDRSFQG